MEHIQAACGLPTLQGLSPGPTAWLVPSLEPLCVCSCLVVIRSSQRTTAPSHLQGGPAGHTAPFSAPAALAPVSRRDGESWNSLCLLVLNLNSLKLRRKRPVSGLNKNRSSDIYSRTCRCISLRYMCFVSMLSRC